MSFQAGLLAAFSYCLVTQTTADQFARLSSAPKDTVNREAVNLMLARADLEGSGVVRFDSYEEVLVLSSGYHFPAMRLWTYTVFEDQASLSAWSAWEEQNEGGGSFVGKDMALHAGLSTVKPTLDAVGDLAPPNPLFFWVHVQTADFEKTKNAFKKIVEPTRAESGAWGYEQACSISDENAFCWENVWYKNLPTDQNEHMMTAHMAAFFGDTAGVVMGWKMSTLKILDKPAPDTAIVQYLRVDDHSTIKDHVPDCNYFEISDLAKKVDDKCCDIATWPDEAKASQTPAAERTSETSGDKKWACYTEERVPVPCDAADPSKACYTRNFVGCQSGILEVYEGCAPEGTSMGNGYPMNMTFGKASNVDGSSEECGCEQAYKGDGCFVALTGYMMGLPGADATANFLKVEGNENCEWSPRAAADTN